MNDFEKIELVFDMFEDAEVIQEFDNYVWLKVDKEMYEQLRGEML